MRARFTVLLFLFAATLFVGAIPAADDKKADLPEVTFVNPISREITDHEEFTGRTEAVATVEIRPRVSGILDKVSFREGDSVKKGDVLFEISAKYYRLDVELAEAEVARTVAHLKVAEIDLERAKKMRDGPEGEMDRLTAWYDEAKATVAVARATLERARLLLDLTHITAPADGRIGRSLLDAGNVVQADTTHLATLVSTSQVYVSFSVGEHSYLRLVRQAPEGNGKDLRDVPVQMGLADEEGFPRAGKIQFVDTRLDPQTGTIHLRAVFPNPKGWLVPGLSARVRLATSEPYKALLVPEEAVDSRDPPTVWVVNEKDRVEPRTVKLGSRAGGVRVIKEGIRADDRIVIEGLRDLRPGMAVRAKKAARHEELKK
jgi:RND family efflux transporter MFP subunit